MNHGTCSISFLLTRQGMVSCVHPLAKFVNPLLNDKKFGMLLIYQNHNLIFHLQ